MLKSIGQDFSNRIERRKAANLGGNTMNDSTSTYPFKIKILTGKLLKTDFLSKDYFCSFLFWNLNWNSAILINNEMKGSQTSKYRNTILLILPQFQCDV